MYGFIEIMHREEFASSNISDGEREIEVNSGDQIEMVLEMGGPKVGDIPKIFERGDEKGVFSAERKLKNG